jgi:ribosomal protein L14
MLQSGCKLYVCDNSGILSIKIIKQKGNNSAKYIFLSDLILGVLKDFDIYKNQKLKRKDTFTCIVVTVCKKYSKGNGLYARWSENRCIPLKITRFIVPIASYVETPVYYEMKHKKKFKLI